MEIVLAALFGRKGMKGEFFEVGQDRDISFVKNKKSVTIKISDKEGREISRRRIPEIGKDEVSRFISLGVAEGVSFYHCIYLAAKHCRDFIRLASVYRMVLSKSRGCSCAVEFYGKRGRIEKMNNRRTT